jgi:hypothetical protein
MTDAAVIRTSGSISWRKNAFSLDSNRASLTIIGRPLEPPMVALAFAFGEHSKIERIGMLDTLETSKRTTRKITVGVNDLATTHPDIAALAIGWDPTTVTAGSRKRLLFACPNGHEPRYTNVFHITTDQTGCRKCRKRPDRKGPEYVHVGVNDLATTHPDVAALAVGWDPSTVTARSGKYLLFSCPNGHAPRLAYVNNRTRPNRVGCAECPRSHAGVNDLATTHPDIAALAVGWDPSTVMAGSIKRQLFTCVNGCPPRMVTVHSVVVSDGRCAKCPRRRGGVRANNLVTTHPDIAALAVGWDPSTVMAGSIKRQLFTCVNGCPPRMVTVHSVVVSDGRCAKCPRPQRPR